VDLAIAAVLTVATQAEHWLVTGSGAAVGAVAVSLAVGTIAIAWHRVAPLTALVVGLTGLVVVPGALGVDPSSAFGWLIAAFTLMASAGYHARRPWVSLVIALGLLALSIVVQKGFVISDIAFGWLLCGGAWLAGRAVASRTLRAELSEQRAAHAEEESRWRAAAAVAEERLRIAREMHDVVSHSVSVMTLHAGGVRRLLLPQQVAERDALETIERTGRESLAEMHRMLGLLRGPDGEGTSPAPGLARLPELLEAPRSAGLQATLMVTGEARPVPPGLELAAYRIVQEAVTNVLRHAGARRVECTVTYRDDAVEIGVVDDGPGTASPATAGHGLVGMRERAAAYGGTVDAGPRRGGGFAVRAVLPVARPAGDAEPELQQSVPGEAP
jgi:signal transduction histidine kinase